MTALPAIVWMVSPITAAASHGGEGGRWSPDDLLRSFIDSLPVYSRPCNGKWYLGRSGSMMMLAASSNP
jgi:hypothetical protein